MFIHFSSRSRRPEGETGGIEIGLRRHSSNPTGKGDILDPAEARSRESGQKREQISFDLIESGPSLQRKISENR